jgi:hypothetical protein
MFHWEPLLHVIALEGHYEINDFTGSVDCELVKFWKAGLLD